MSAHVEVIASDLRRAKVKVTPGTYLIDVLREACQKLNLSNDKYLLKYKQKQIDLSVPFRTSGLGHGAKLELVSKSSSPTVINVALQFSGRDASMIPNGRLTGKFPSNLSIWKVLRQFESGEASGGHNLNITSRGAAQSNASGEGQLYHESPVLNIMGRELSSLEDFQKTLSQCGINSGSVLIRVSFRATAKTLYQAMQDISQYFGEIEGPRGQAEPTETGKGTSAPPPTRTEGEQNTDSTLAPTSRQIAQSVAPEGAAPTPIGNDGSAAPAGSLLPVDVFSAPTGNTPAAALVKEDDSDFAPTAAHAQLHQARLQASSQNKRLKSDRELAAEAADEAARLGAVKSVRVRVRFPDGTSALWQLDPGDTGAMLYHAVRAVMADDSQPFKLVLPGGGGTISDAEDARNSLIRGLGLRGGVLLNLVWAEGASPEARKQPFLRSTVAKRAREVVIPEIPRGEDEEEDQKTAVAAGHEAKTDKGGKGAEGSTNKLPKWLKLPGMR